MNLINAFDPSTNTVGTIDANSAQKCSKILLYNHSNVGLALAFSNGSKQILPAWWVKTFKMPQSGTSRIDWSQAYILQSDSTSISTVYGESYLPSENAPDVNQQIFTTNTQTSVLNASNYGAGGATLTIPVSNTGKLLYVTGFTISSGPPTSTQGGTLSIQGLQMTSGTPSLNYFLTQSAVDGMLFDKVFPFPVPQQVSGPYYNGTVEIIAQNFNPSVDVSVNLYGIYK